MTISKNKLQLYKSIGGTLKIYDLPWEEKLDVLATLLSWILSNMCTTKEQKLIILQDFIDEVMETDKLSGNLRL